MRLEVAVYPLEEAVREEVGRTKPQTGTGISSLGIRTISRGRARICETMRFVCRLLELKLIDRLHKLKRNLVLILRELLLDIRLTRILTSRTSIISNKNLPTRVICIRSTRMQAGLLDSISRIAMILWSLLLVDTEKRPSITKAVHTLLRLHQDLQDMMDLPGMKRLATTLVGIGRLIDGEVGESPSCRRQDIKKAYRLWPGTPRLPPRVSGVYRRECCDLEANYFAGIIYLVGAPFQVAHV